MLLQSWFLKCVARAIDEQARIGNLKAKLLRFRQNLIDADFLVKDRRGGRFEATRMKRSPGGSMRIHRIRVMRDMRLCAYVEVWECTGGRYSLVAQRGWVRMSHNESEAYMDDFASPPACRVPTAFYNPGTDTTYKLQPDGTYWNGDIGLGLYHCRRTLEESGCEPIYD